MNHLPMNSAAAGVTRLREIFFIPFFAGEILADKYEVLDLIGAGAASYVISARRIDQGDKIAIKLLRPEISARQDVVARLIEEARAASMIHSQHVPRVFEVGSFPDVGPFIAMELLEGQDLSSVIAQRGPLPTALAVEYVLQACEALATAHACGFVHGAVKPENLFLTRSLLGLDVIKVLEFGTSRVVVSPEQLRVQKDGDACSDIWGLGCALYELLTGSPAFAARSPGDSARKIVERDLPPIRRCRADVAPELEAIVHSCLREDREHRFASIGDLAIALSPFASERATLCAQRACHVLRAAGVWTTTAPSSVPSMALDAEPASLRASVRDEDGEHASKPPGADIGFTATRARELERPSWKDPRRVVTGLAWTVIAAACAWTLQLSRSISAPAGPVGEGTSAASVPLPAASSDPASTPAITAAVSSSPTTLHASTARDTRSTRTASRASAPKAAPAPSASSDTIAPGPTGAARGEPSFLPCAVSADCPRDRPRCNDGSCESW